ncbi:MAG TPA: hypothetical protein VD905_19610 [Flavobacteriales bacterium]|nr:hypothetical protein [Flavobacteriales bacterium]
MRTQQDTSTNIFLTAAVVLANVDYSGLLEYGLKAAIGGMIWMGFKLAGDGISNYLRKRNTKK